MTTALDAADAIVYDLDGTLLELAVDWDAVADDVVGAYAANALVPPTGDLWSLLDAAADYGIEAVVHGTIADHERTGARESALLPLGERLAAGADDHPAAVCSLNCEDACRIALETHGLEGAVDAVVGRDTAETHKPEPESLLAAIEALGVEPERAAFVGDSESDAVTADRAGVPFVSVVDALGE
ncbi:HAD family hydrolase [Halorubrum rubrum]|uniref:HAD family hydrolase n=1 Tax=Halorubrum rubrum TaxID=1126240 RepID=A0ABD5QZ83_9EURY|nr:HAD-IA family hydrolase [Halorubrum rubrum]